MTWSCFSLSPRVMTCLPTAQVLVLETADVVLATAEAAEKFFILRIEEVEAAITTVVFLDGSQCRSANRGATL